MAISVSCCYLSVQNFLNLLDPCVCNMPGGGTLVLSDGTIYIRTKTSTPCSTSDFTTLGTTLNFNIADTFSNVETINVGNTITYVGENGVVVKVSSPDTVTINGLTTFGTTAPTTPTNSSQVNTYVNTSTGEVYFWNPNSSVWLGPISGLSFQNSTTITWSTPATNVKKADVINAPLGGLTSTITGEQIKKDTVTNSNDNVLQLGNQGTYVPPATRQLATATVATTDESLPFKVVQLQSGVPKVVNHYHQPVADFRISFKTGLIIEVMPEISETQPNDNLTYLWTVSSGTVIAPTDALGTEIDFTAPGEYTVTLKVTNEAGISDSSSKIVKVARIIDVQGASEENNTLYTSLQNAMNWIDTFDAGNSALYTINVWGTTTDVTTISPNMAKVVFQGLGNIGVGVSFTIAGAYKWTGLNHEYGSTHIRLSTTTAININSGCNVEFDGLTIYQPNANGSLINNAGTLTVRNCILLFSSNNSSGILCNNGSLLNCFYTEFIGSSINLRTSLASIDVQHCKFFGSMTNVVRLLQSTGTFAHNTIILTPNTLTVDCYALEVDPHATGDLAITHNLLKVTTDNGTAKIIGGLAIFNTGAQVIISNNVIFSKRVGVIVGSTNTTSFIFVNNFVSAVSALVSNTGTFSPIVLLAFANFPAYNNVWDGTINGPVTFAAATALATVSSENTQV